MSIDRLREFLVMLQLIAILSGFVAFLTATATSIGMGLLCGFLLFIPLAVLAGWGFCKGAI